MVHTIKKIIQSRRAIVKRLSWRGGDWPFNANMTMELLRKIYQAVGNVFQVHFGGPCPRTGVIPHYIWDQKHPQEWSNIFGFVIYETAKTSYYVYDVVDDELGQVAFYTIDASQDIDGGLDDFALWHPNVDLYAVDLRGRPIIRTSRM